MTRPNVILISLDTVRADHLSCYGYGRSETPMIDAIASEGTIYRQNFSTGVWTPPGHASMLTGLYVSEHGVYDNNRLDESIPAIATTLRDHGYKTAGFVCNSQVGALVGLDRGHDLFVEVWKGVETNSMAEKIAKGVARRIRQRIGYNDMGAARTNREFENWLDGLPGGGSPFYAFLHYIEAHNPLSPPRPYNVKYPRGMNIERVRKVAHNPLVCFIEDLPLTEREREFIVDLYDAEIRYLDAIVGEVARMLRQRGLYDDTMIVITADHGEHFGEYGLWSHVASLYREVLHVPLIIKFPAGTPCLGEVASCTQLVDIFPTVMEVTGVDSEKGPETSGKSLVYRGAEGLFHEYVFAEWEGRVPYYIQRNSSGQDRASVDALRVQMSMVQDERHKYILKSNGEEILLHVGDGPERPVEIGDNRACRDRMREELMRRAGGLGPGGREERKVDKEIEENLKALGYL